MQNIVVVTLVVGLAVAGVPSVLAQAPPVSAKPTQSHKLTGAEIRAAFVGNTAYTPGRFGPKTIAGYFSPDGQVRFRSPDVQDVGTYRITEDGMDCSKFSKLRGGQETCMTIYQADQSTFEAHLPDGSIRKSTIVSGNPEGL